MRSLSTQPLHLLFQSTLTDLLTILRYTEVAHCLQIMLNTAFEPCWTNWETYRNCYKATFSSIVQVLIMMQDKFNKRLTSFYLIQETIFCDDVYWYNKVDYSLIHSRKVKPKQRNGYTSYNTIVTVILIYNALFRGSNNHFSGFLV